MMMSGINQSQKVTLIKYLWNDKIIETEKRLVVPRD